LSKYWKRQKPIMDWGVKEEICGKETDNVIAFIKSKKV